ncbi:SPOR domain-containing protein [bacterium]|nr:SPOR domain-containing protein [bacterium]
MKNFLFITLGIVIIVSLIFLLGYLAGRGYDLREEPIAKRIEKKETISKPPVSPSPKVGLPPAPLEKNFLMGYTVQVASSQSEEKALALVNRLKAKEYPAYIEEVELKGKKWFRVRIGSFQNREDALKLVDILKEKEGLKEAIVWKR